MYAAHPLLRKRQCALDNRLLPTTAWPKRHKRDCRHTALPVAKNGQLLGAARRQPISHAEQCSTARGYAGQRRSEAPAQAAKKNPQRCRNW
jgi:hypothetical protein